MYGLNTSKRNISMAIGKGSIPGIDRPRTAAVAGGNILRPPTAAINNGTRFKGNFLPSGFGLGRAVSASIVNNPKLKRYEDLITRIKKLLELEKKSLRIVKTMCSKEIEAKNSLEKILRGCVEDVKAEIQKKKSENKSIYY